MLLWLDIKHMFLTTDDTFIVVHVWCLDFNALFGDGFSTELIMDTLTDRGLDFLICPHIRLNGEVIAYYMAYWLQQSYPPSDICPLFDDLTCSGCNTRIRLNISKSQGVSTDTRVKLPEVTKGWCLKMTVVKNLGKLRLAVEKEFLEHSALEHSETTAECCHFI